MRAELRKGYRPRTDWRRPAAVVPWREIATKHDREGRAIRVASAVLVALFLLVVLSNLVWPSGPPPGEQRRAPPDESPFPTFRLGPRLQVVRLPEDANVSTRLLMTSLQGLVNREAAELYLDVGGVAGNTSEMLSFLGSRYNMSHDVLSMGEAINRYRTRIAGLVVVDPVRPESVNVGTMVAALRDAALVGPDLVGWMRAQYGLQVLFDYASSDWAPLGPVGAADRALRDLYPSTATSLLSILPPDRWAIRDYLIATRTFVFYLPQGIFASPFDIAATRRILHAAPRGIPILGWFNTPTLTEENAFVQMASEEGKFIVGAQDLPNLSVLTAIARNATHRQRPAPPSSAPLEDKMYIVLAVSDGDNLDFVANRMRELWSESVRGTLPIAWSMNPLLVDLAPPLLDSYYETASPLDRFIAAPSGAGYLYPDYASREDLAAHVAFSRRYLAAADLDVVWLLNAFVASEIPYTSASLSTVVDGLRPNGVVLDYDDQPRARDAWVQAGAEAFAPVIRSTHLYTTNDNAFGKLRSAEAADPDGPYFVWLTIYSFTFDLKDVRSFLDALPGRMNRPIEIVEPGRLFAVLRQDFLRGAKERLDSIATNPIASFVSGGRLASASLHLNEAEAHFAAGDTQRGAYAAFVALEELRAASATEAIMASFLVVLAGGLFALFASRAPNPVLRPRTPMRFGGFVFILATVAFLVFGLREALQQNFWTYPSILLGLAIAGIHRPLRRVLDRAYPDRAPVAAAILFLVLVDLAIRTTVAFPLALVGALLGIDAYLARVPTGTHEMLLGLLLGTAVGFLGGFDLLTFAILAIVLVAAAVPARGPPRPDSPTGRRALSTGVLVALPLSALSVGMYYAMALRLSVQGELATLLSGALLVLAPTLAILLRRAFPRGSHRTLEIAGLVLAAIFGGIVLATHGTLSTILALLGLFASLAFVSITALDRFVDIGGDPRRALAAAILLIPPFLLFLRMPPVVYSLALVPIPEAIEHALYTPPIMIAATALAAAALLGIAPLLRSRVEKGYPAAAHRGTGRP